MLANYPQDCSNCLSPSDVDNLLLNDPTASNAYIQAGVTGTWPTGNPVGIGWTIQDPTYGPVTLVIDGTGALYVLTPSGGTTSQNSAVTTIQTVTNNPPYQSPTLPPCPGWSNVSGIDDFFACFRQSLGTLGWVVAIVAGLYLYKELK